MMIPIEYILIGASILLLLSIIASKISERLSIPVLLAFLVVGMLAGSEGPGGSYFNNPWLTQSLGLVALAFIIFSGGLDTTWENIRPVLWKGLALSTLGVFITALLVGLPLWCLAFPCSEVCCSARLYHQLMPLLFLLY